MERVALTTPPIYSDIHTVIPRDVVITITRKAGEGGRSPQNETGSNGEAVAPTCLITPVSVTVAKRETGLMVGSGNVTIIRGPPIALAWTRRRTHLRTNMSTVNVGRTVICGTFHAIVRNTMWLGRKNDDHWATDCKALPSVYGVDRRVGQLR